MSTPNTKTPPTPSSLPPHPMGIKRKFLWFTLVELIVVITILVILWTIAFLNLWGFSGSARDSARISNLANLQKGLNVYQVRTWTYPMPESSVAITASWTPIGYQWFAKDIVWGIAKISKWWTVDPSDSNIYTTYAVNQTLTKMQAMVFLEDSGNVTAYEEIPPTPLTKGGIIAFFNPLIKGVTSEASWGIPGIDTTYASLTTDYSKRFPKTTGDTLGILLSTATGTLNQPVQETGTGVDIISATGSYTMYFDRDTKVTGTGIVLKSGIVSTKGLVGYWDMETLTSDGKLADLSGNGNNGTFSGGMNYASALTWGIMWKWLNFNDSNWDVIDMGSSESLKISKEITIFVNIKSRKNELKAVLSKQSAGVVDAWTNCGVNNYCGYQIQAWIDKIWGRVYDTSLNWYATADRSRLAIKSYANSWIQIAYRVTDGTFWDVFIDWNQSTNIEGNSFKQDRVVWKMNVSNGPLLIWKYWNDTTSWLNYDYFDGIIDEVRIYNRALSDSEIQTLYNTTK